MCRYSKPIGALESFATTLCPLQAKNGVVHIIDNVLIPNHIQEQYEAWLARGSAKSPALPNLVQLVLSVPSLSTLATALSAANLVNVLEGPGPFTVLAPSNDVSDSASQ